MPKVSVIIPVYNVERYLGECLDSILGQTLKEIEVLCVDDASTDASPRILADYAAKDSRVRVFHAEHGGAFKARKIGVEAANGEYIHFMDADDLLEPRTFEELCARMDRDRLDHVVFESSVFCESDVTQDVDKWAAAGLRNYYSLPRSLDGRIMTGMELMGVLLDAKHFNVSPPLRLIRADVIQGHEYIMPDAQSRADNYFTPVSLYYSQRTCVVAKPFYRRRVRNDSITTAADAERRHFRNLLHVLAALCSFPPFARDLGDPHSPIARFSAVMSQSFNRWAWKISGEERLSILREAFASWPSETSALLLQAWMLGVRELRKRPNTVLKCLKFLIRKMLGRS